MMSAHALGRLSRLDKPGYVHIAEEEVIELLKKKPNYSEGENKVIWFDREKQLVIVKNKTSGDIVSIVRRKNEKETWNNVSV